MRSLSTQTALTISICLFFVTVGQTWIIGQTFRQMIYRLAEEKMHMVLANQATVMANPLWDFDDDQVRNAAVAVSHERMIAGARVVDLSRNDARVVVAVGAAQELPGLLTDAQGANHNAIFHSDDAAVLPGHHDIMSQSIEHLDKNGQSRVVGRLDLVVDYSQVEQDLNVLQLKLLLVTAVAFGILIFLVSAILRRSIAPVRKLADLVSQDDAVHRPLHEIDAIKIRTAEFGMLAGAIKTFQRQYLDYRDKIIAAKDAAETARQTAERADKAKTEFLANMSHELRTPLNSIIGLTQLIADDDVNPKHKSMLQTIDKSSHTLLHTVNDILDISKIESSNLTLESVPFNLLEYLTDVVTMLRQQATEKGLALDAKLYIDRKKNVLGDPKRFMQVVTNLLGNAIKYTESGVVRLLVEHADKADNTTVVTMRFSDTGIGIAPDRLGSVFEKFVQADASITRRFGGTGLGLAIAKQLVEYMQGTITVESTLGIGSTFTVCLPFIYTSEAAVTLSESQPQLKKAERTIPAAAARVLVAEDHQLNQFFMRNLLPAIGCSNFTIVENGQLALDAAEAGLADIILMDCHMPVMTGYEATTAIRALEIERGGHVPIVAMTANALVGERENCLKIGMDEYLSKPVNREKLVAILSTWLDFEKRVPSLPTTTEPELIDIAHLNELCGDRSEFKKELLTMFFKDADAMLEVLKQNCVEGESKTWKEVSHQLKGGAATAGAVQLRFAAAESQDMLVSTAEARHAMLGHLNRTYEKARQEMMRLGLV
ncbi:MAG: response regulator [Alphaproteobacteria bacterium]|nr:response regulator [Alphaproteobacteria bacterium]